MANTKVGGRNRKDKLGQSMQSLVAIVRTLDHIPYIMGSQWRALSKGVTCSHLFLSVFHVVV